MRGAWQIAGLCLLWIAGCAAPRTMPGLGAEGDFLSAKEMFDSGRYFNAVQALEAFRTANPGSDRVDDATYYLGLAHMHLDEHLLAEQEFDRLLGDYPTSEHREDAEYERALSFFESAHSPARDPEPILSAQQAFESYLRHYPDGAHRTDAERLLLAAKDRLAVKHYLNGETYRQLRQPKAAIIYYEKSLAILEESSRAGAALFGMAECQATLGQTEQARATYQRLIDFATDERMAKNPGLRKLRDKASAAITALEASGSAAGSASP
ncbi:MAG: outer membrane protein assembly factor BamD [Candidatus Eisenbacteria bacterium]